MIVCSICRSTKEDTEFYKGQKVCKQCYITRSMNNYREKLGRPLLAYDRKTDEEIIEENIDRWAKQLTFTDEWKHYYKDLVRI